MKRLAYDVTAVTGKVRGHHTGPGMNMMMTYIWFGDWTASLELDWCLVSAA
jgi:hypothetical protein